MSLDRGFYRTVIATCTVATLLGTAVLATVVHPDAQRSLAHGPWVHSGTSWQTHRDEDGVRLQMRRAYRVSGLHAATRLRLINLHSDETILDIEPPDAAICFGRPTLEAHDTQPWYDLGDTHRDTRLKLVVECGPDADTPPIIETRIKPGIWSRWTRWWSR